MFGRETPLPPPGPSLAWGSQSSPAKENSPLQGQPAYLLKAASSGAPLPGRRLADSLRAVSPGSWPKNADTLSSASDISSFNLVATSESELRTALCFMHRFLQDTRQAVFTATSSDRIRFMECIDMLSSTIHERGPRFMEEIYDAALIKDALQFLLLAASSRNSHEREMSLARMTRLIGCVPSYAIGKGMKDLKLGQVAGCFILCCSDSCEAVCLWAADGLHHLYTLIMKYKSKGLPVDNPKHQALLKEWEEEKIFWLAWFSSITDATMVFKRCLRPEEQTDLILMAIRGMRNDNIHNTKCAIRMLKTMLRDPAPELMKASKAVPLIYKYLEHITDSQGHRVVLHYLRMLGTAYPDEVVKALLGCSLQCDRNSGAMWRALTSFSNPTKDILAVLQFILLEQPLNLEGTKAALNPLAANSALYEILKRPTSYCKELLREIYPTLSIALLCQISYTRHFMPKETELYWRTCIQQKTPTPLAPFRSALRTFKALLRCASHGDQVLIMNKRRGSELLLNPSTHQKGLYLFARSMIRNEDCTSILPYLLKTLENPEDFRHITLMTFLVELLRHQTFSSIAAYQIIRQLWKQLNSSKVELRSLALDGMLLLAAHPDKLAMLEPALPDILARLKESNRAVNVKALKVVGSLLKSLSAQDIFFVTKEIATPIIPLFDDASHKVRLAAISAFNCLLDVMKDKETEEMKDLAMQSLVPLMVHLYDGSPQVTQVALEALKNTDKLLKSFFQRKIHENDMWKYCMRLLKRYRKLGEAILVEQAFSYLENPQHSLRDVALKLLEIIAMGSKSRETVNAIATVLNLVKRDSETNTTDLVPQFMEAIAQESSSENLQTVCCGGFRKRWKLK